jgi:hypothetical protein
MPRDLAMPTKSTVPAGMARLPANLAVAFVVEHDDGQIPNRKGRHRLEKRQNDISHSGER